MIMIQLADLRIGNWYIANGKIFIMDMRMMHAFTGFGDPYDIKNVSGIELTSEILEKAGFIVKDDNPKKKQWYEGDVLVNICGFEFTNTDKQGSNGGFYSYDLNQGKTIIKYLHQLQNLYYFLTGEELQITFDKV